MNPAKFTFSAHSLQRSENRGIPQRLFMEVVTSPKTKRQQYRGSHGGFVYLLTKDIDGKELHVVAELYKDECYFVTAYWNEDTTHQGKERKGARR